MEVAEVTLLDEARADAPEPVAPPPPAAKSGPLALLQRSVGELRPNVVAGGAPILPLILLSALNVVDGFDAAAVGVLLPEIRDYFGVSIAMITLANSLTGVLSVFLAVPIGFMTDRVNRVWMTAAGGVLVGIMALCTGLAWSFFALAAFRFGAGIGKTLLPVQGALLADSYPPSARGGVFSFHQMANRFGNFIAPILAGLLASLFFWQLPFLILGIPTLVLAAVVAIKFREPVRGEQERRAMGLDETAALTGEAPPTWTESWRIAKSVRTLRRFWWSLPFLVASGQVIVPIMGLFYSEVFGLGPGARGVINAVDEPIAMVGLLIGVTFVNRFLRYRPGRVITAIGLLSVGTGLSFAVIAISPYVWIAITFKYLGAFLGALVAPATTALMTMVIPPRVRGFALSVGAVFIVPGLALGPLFGGIADRVGLRAGLLLMTPVYLIGAAIITSAGSSVEADIRAAQAASAASYVARESKKSGKAKLLVVRDLDVHYDAVQILFNVDFEVDEGEIIALLGTNGAGKSTLLRAISGLTQASNGAIFFDGEDITFLPPSAHAAKGIVQVPGGKGVFPQLTVAENLRLAAWLFRRDADYVKAATESVLERFPVLRDTLGRAGRQPLGRRAADADARPGVPVATPTPDDRRAVARPGPGDRRAAARHRAGDRRERHHDHPRRAVRERRPHRGPAGRVHGEGRGPLLRAHRRAAEPPRHPPSRLPQGHGRRRIVGRVRAAPGVDPTRRRAARCCALSSPASASASAASTSSTASTSCSRRARSWASSVRTARARPRCSTSSPASSPPTKARSACSARTSPTWRPTSGPSSVSCDRSRTPACSRRSRSTRTSPSPSTGTSTSRSTIGAALHLPSVAKAERTIAKRVDRLIRLMNLEELQDKFVRELSTGSRRIVDLACVLACDPKVLLLDEPSSGIAQRETEELGPLLQRIRCETGCAMLLIEHDMPLISAVSDELIALDLGTTSTRGPAADVLEHPRVVESYLGTSDEAINRSGDLA